MKGSSDKPIRRSEGRPARATARYGRATRRPSRGAASGAGSSERAAASARPPVRVENRRNTQPGAEPPRGGTPALLARLQAAWRTRSEDGARSIADGPAHPRVMGPADAVLTGTLIALVAFGVVMVYSASAVFAHGRYGDGQHFLVRQAVYAALALPTTVALARFDYHRLRPLTYLILGGACALLAYTAFGGGKSAGGASRWIALGPIHVQPAEIAKVSLICWLAYSLSKKSQQIRSFSVGFLPHVLVAGLLMVLCLKQPDFGSAVMMGLITFVMLFTAGARLGYMLGGGLLALPVAYFLIASSEYRMRRITAFLSPFEHRYTSGYQIAESLMSFGSGGLTGVGIGDSRQKLFFLPEAHTDFISAIIGEELGFVGFFGLVCAYLVLVARGLRAAYRAADDYGTYLAVGITMFVGMQAFVNLAVAVGLLPTKGLVLPFVSYGGSALLVNCAAIGLLLNVSRPRQVTQSPPPELRTENSKSRRKRKRGNARLTPAVARTGGL